MHSSDEKSRQDRLQRNPRKPTFSSSISPSFSSSLLEEIYRSIDDGDDKRGESKIFKDRINNVKRQSSTGCGGGSRVKAKAARRSIEKEDMASLRRARLIEKLMEKKVSDKVSSSAPRPLPELVRKSQQHQASVDPDLFFSSSSSSSLDSTNSGGTFSSSSDKEFFGMAKSITSCFTATRTKPVRTSNVSVSVSVSVPVPVQLVKPGNALNDFGHQIHHVQNHEELKNGEGGLLVLKLRALKIYSNLKKMKQPISPGGRLASFLNSLFTNGNAKKEEEDKVPVERKIKSLQASNLSTCSTTASSSYYYRSCLTKTSLNSKEKEIEKSNKGVMKRTVRFYPVSVIVDEDCRPFGHKCIYEDHRPGKIVVSPPTTKDELKLVLAEKNRKIEEAAREILKGYAKNQKQNKNEDDNDNDNDNEEDNDAASDLSSDLFELDHLPFIGNNNNVKNNNRYCEELPVYETTHIETNRAIANGLIC